MSKPRVLIDTNTLLSGLIWNGNEAQVLELSMTGRIQILIPAIVIQEARRVLALKFPEHADVLDSVIAMMDCEILPRPSTESIATAARTIRDKNDAEVLASAVQFKPDHALSGDKDLLAPEVQAIFPTSRCRDFLRKMDDEG